jgi:hypothetical protein
MNKYERQYKMDCSGVVVGDKLKLRSEPDKWWTVEKISEMKTELKDGPICCRMFYFVEPHEPATEPNVVGWRTRW